MKKQRKFPSLCKEISYLALHKARIYLFRGHDFNFTNFISFYKKLLYDVKYFLILRPVSYYL